MKRKVFTIALALFAAASAWAQTTFTIDNLKYTVTDETAKTVELTGYGTWPEGTLDIPATVSYNSTTYSVTSIGYYAFRDCSALTQVTIPESVTSIGNYAFSSCSALTQVNIPNSVTSVGNYAFFSCSALTQVNIPNSVTSIGEGVFYGCRALTQVNIPNSVTSIGDYAFSGCSSLTQVTIPESVTSIGEGAFFYCSALTQVNIPNGVTSIRDYTFRSCTALTQVTLPNSVTSIGNEAFSCSKLTQVTLPNSVTSIGYAAFADCSALTQVTIPESVTSIGDYAFSGCSALTQVTWNAINYANFIYTPFDDCPVTTFFFGDQVEHIPANLCYGMDKLTQVTIPDGVTSIGRSAFSGCSALTQVTWNAINCADFTSSNSSPFYNSRSTITVFTFGDQVKWIPAYLCYGMDKLTQVTLPNSVESIGEGAFLYCSALTQVTIGNSVKSIGNDAFYYCSALTQVTIPNNVKSIGNDAFHGCSKLTQVTIGNSVTSIGEGAFSGCSALTAVYYTGDVAGWCGITFENYDSNPKYYARNLYIGNTLVTELVIPEGVSEIKDYAFYRCSALTQVNIPNGVTSIGNYAFYYCSALTQVTIPDGVTSIGERAFYETALYNNDDNWTNNVLYIDNCLIAAKTKLSGSYKIAAGTRLIAGRAFSNCSALTQVTIPNSVTSIGDYAFYDCSKLTQVTIPNSVTSIGSSAFEGCSALTQVNIPNSVTSIGYWAFQNCSALTQVTIPESVTSIGDAAFSGCSALTQVSIPESVTSIGERAFFGCSTLAEMTVLATVPPTVGVDAFYNVSRSIPVYVPAESLEDYQAAETWREFNLQAMQTALHTPSMPESIRMEGGMLHNPQQLPVSIYDMQGRMVYSGTAATVSQPAGVYVVLCAGASHKVLF